MAECGCEYRSRDAQAASTSPASCRATARRRPLPQQASSVRTPSSSSNIQTLEAASHVNGGTVGARALCDRPPLPRRCHSINNKHPRAAAAAASETHMQICYNRRRPATHKIHSLPAHVQACCSRPARRLGSHRLQQKKHMVSASSKHGRNRVRLFVSVTEQSAPWGAASCQLAWHQPATQQATIQHRRLGCCCCCCCCTQCC